MVLMIEDLPDRLHAFADNTAHARAAAEQHPILFGYLVREIIASGGPKGEKAIQEAVRFYGARRGKRMADKAVKSGFQNDLLGCLLFTELDVSEVGNVVKIERRKPCLEVGCRNAFGTRYGRGKDCWSSENFTVATSIKPSSKDSIRAFVSRPVTAFQPGPPSAGSFIRTGNLGCRLF